MRHLKGLEFERREALKIKVFGLYTWIDMEGEIKVLGSSAVLWLFLFPQPVGTSPSHSTIFPHSLVAI